MTRALSMLLAIHALGCGAAQRVEPAAATIEDLRAMSVDDRAFAARVGEGGLVFIEVREDASGEDPRADERGLVRVAARYCGDALAPVVARLRADLALRLERPEDVGLACQADLCTHHAFGEFDVDGAYRFAPGPTLIEIVRIEGGAMAEEWTRTQRAWADGELARLRASPCPAR